ncbi:hypothetical protein GCM10009836_47830 [Pseudonocardia ailaonensis]|uniref:PASTA domain-containing protein n=1 Tax=Pseudonocardia ailaonensis TaxID=367279 RepID=A0ABN2NBP1_9PSEU
MTRPVAGVGFALLTVLLLAGCGGTASPATTSTTAVATPPVTTATKPSAAAGATSWTMPNLVGSNLQDAQNAIQHLTGFAISLTHSHDATGRGRHQVLDRNWKVCDQNVPAGRTITTGTSIDFGAVQLDETCRTS